MTAHSEHGGGQDALARELASCEEDEPAWPDYTGRIRIPVPDELMQDAEIFGQAYREAVDRLAVLPAGFDLAPPA